MNKAVIIAVALLVLIGGSLFLLKKQAPTKPQNAMQKTAPAATKQSMQGTLKSLLNLGTSQKCTFSNALANASVNGTVFVSNGKMKGDFKTSTNTMNITGHMVVDSQTMYFWTDMSNQGFKMSLSSQGQPTPTNSQTPDINQSFTYSCQDWVVDPSAFTLPSTVTFSSFALPSQMPSNTAPTAMSQNQCNSCNYLAPGPMRDACRTQLHCQ